MGFRFQKRVKLLPGVTLNLSKKGVSTSLGVKGARVTYGHGKKRTTIGLPGTGLSHTSVKSTRKPRRTTEEDAYRRPRLARLLGWIFGFTVLVMLLAII